jgi:hypothetical protein
MLSVTNDLGCGSDDLHLGATAIRYFCYRMLTANYQPEYLGVYEMVTRPVTLKQLRARSVCLWEGELYQAATPDY